VADVVPPRHGLHRLLLDRIPRGGYSPPTSHAAAGAAAASSVDSKKKRKKKKASKLRQQHTQAESSSSSSSSATTSASQKQHADADINSSNDTDSNNPTKPPQFHSSNNTNAKSAHQNDDTTSSSSSSSSSQQQQQQQLPPAVQSILSHSCHYDVLGITNKAASQIEIQKAYRRRCVLTHPDKLPGGIRTAFDKVSEAYEVLSCEKKRAVYDRYGKEGLEKGIASASGGGGSSSGMDFRFGTTSGASFFGNDLFREFFGQQQSTSSTTNSAFRWAQPQPSPRNRDLRYQLEVSLEELYNGTTKHVAIQQPNPLKPYFPYRKELEVALPRGIGNGQSVRLSGVVDSVSDSPPADVIFLIRERRHPIYTRRGHDLAMEVRISLSEAIVGYRRTMTCLDGRSIVIGSPVVRKVVQKREVVDVPSLPVEEMNEDGFINADADTTPNDTDVITKQQQLPEQATKTTIVSYDLPPSILQTGDVHVLKGYGMPIRGSHHHEQYGDLYIQYVVEMPFGSSSSSSAAASTSASTRKVNAANLSPEERVELARLLSKLEGRSDDPTVGIVHSSSRVDGDATTTTTTVDDDVESGGMNDTVHYLSMASASDFGQSTTTYDDHTDHDEHLRHDDEEDGGGHHGMHHHHHHQDVSDFFRRAFTGAGRSSSPFGGTGGFHYFSSGY